MIIVVNVISPALNTTTTSSPDYGKTQKKHIFLLQHFIRNLQQYYHLEKPQQSNISKP